MICGALYFLKSFKHCRCGVRQKLRTRLLEADETPPAPATTPTQPPQEPAPNTSDKTPLTPREEETDKVP